MAEFVKFLEELRLFSGFERTEAFEMEELLSKVDTGIETANVIIKDLPVSATEEGFLTIGDRPVGEINQIMREGDLVELVKISQKEIPVTGTDIKGFQKLVSDTPEMRTRQVKDLASSAKAKYPQLDVEPEKMEMLSNGAKKDVARVESNLFKYFKQGTVLSLTIGTVVVGVGWISKATSKRKGCHMQTSINGKVTSCKVQAYSCIGTPDGNLCQENLKYYNTTLVLMKLVMLDNTDERKMELAKLVKMDVADLNPKLSQIIDNNYSDVAKFIKNLGDKRPDVDICQIKHQDVENGEIPACRMCTPSAKPTSTLFIDPIQYPNNVAFQCVINPSILDTISDAVINTGKDLWDGITSGIIKFLKPISIFIIIVLILFAIITIGFKLIPQKQSQPPSQPQSSIRYQRI